MQLAQVIGVCLAAILAVMILAEFARKKEE